MKVIMKLGIIFYLAFVDVVLSNSFSGHEGGLTDALFREMVNRMGNDLVDPLSDYVEMPSQSRIPMTLTDNISPRGMPDLPSNEIDYEDLALSPSLRDSEYLAHSSLLGTVLSGYGGNGKTLQRLKPTANGNKATSELKADGVLPAYCNPPNPCPLGYTAEDGCLESFENTASFSRDYQAMQECMCDTEHMFQCSDSTRDSEITALARSIQNEGVLDSTLDKIMSHLNINTRRLVAKKSPLRSKNYNPYLQGEKLPVAAKKGNKW
ncbi:UNVERIFIED_CONTAM: hypothetical protein RMT77_012912 [Armadillidium vulgare]